MLAVGLEITEWAFGALVTVAMAVVGYFVREQEKALSGIAGDVGSLDTRLRETQQEIIDKRHQLRGEFTTLIMREQQTRSSELQTLEARAERSIARVESLLLAQHTETKADLRDLRDDLLKFSTKL